MVDEVAEAAQQVSAESDTVSAAAEEQTSSLTQVAQSAETLVDKADELQDQLAQFRIGQTDMMGQSAGPAQSVSADGGRDREA